MGQTILPADGAEFSRLYTDLRRQAGRLMRREHGFHTLQPTALVHEVWARVATKRPELCQRRDEFLAYAGTAMRSILVNHARRRRRFQNGIDQLAVTLFDSVADSLSERAIDVIALDEALLELATFDPAMARVVELRFFAGLDLPAIAGVIGMAQRTLERHWRATRAWLYRRLS